MTTGKELEDFEAKEKLNTKEEKDVTEALQAVLSHLGSTGLYQRIMFVSMMPIGFVLAFVYFVQMFVAVTPQNHWCKVPELANLTMELRRNLSAPLTAAGTIDRCMTYDTNWTQVLQTLTPPPAGTPLVPCQHGWEFEFVDIPYETVVSEREWVCDSASYVPTVQAMFFVGSLAGGVIFGWTADRFGRIPTLVASNVVAGIGGIATIFTSGVWDFALCRFLVGISYDNCFMMAYILILEYVKPEHRSIIATLTFAIFFGSGCMLLPWISLWIADWRKLLWATSLPLFIVLPVPWILPESASWLVSRGRVDDAVKVLRKFESINKTPIPDEAMDEFIVSSNKSQEEKKESILALFNSPLLRKTMIGMILVYMGCAAVFDGLVRLSDAFGLDFFIAFTFTSATEVPALLFMAAVLDRWGRRNLTSVPLGLAATLIFITIFVPKGIPQATLAIAARFFMNMAFSAVVQWGTEVLPTGFRGSGSSVLHMTGYVATITSPFIVYSERVWKALPLVIIGIICVVASSISLTLPETKGQPMPQTVADGEKLIREQSLCGKREDSGEEEPYKKANII